MPAMKKGICVLRSYKYTQYVGLSKVHASVVSMPGRFWTDKMQTFDKWLS